MIPLNTRAIAQDVIAMVFDRFETCLLIHLERSPCNVDVLVVGEAPEGGGCP